MEVAAKKSQITFSDRVNNDRFSWRRHHASRGSPVMQFAFSPKYLYKIAIGSRLSTAAKIGAG
jgi:hypothetical protein